MNKRQLLFLTFIAILVLPLAIPSSYFRHLLVLSGIFIILTISLNLIMGYIGEISLGHVAFFGIGAYTSTILSTRFAVSFPMSFLSAIMAAGVGGFLIGYPSLKLRGPYFAITTLGFVEILRQIITNWVTLTNGPMGIAGVPSPKIQISNLFRVTIEGEIGFYYFVLFFVAVILYFTSLFLDSRYGRGFAAIRVNEDLASMLGINTFWYKMLGFLIGAFMGGMAGSLYVHYIKFADPSLLSFHYTSTLLTMVMVGGRGSILGSIVGGLLFTIVPEYLRIASTFRMVVLGVLLILSIIFMPEGISGVFWKFWTQRLGRKLD